MHQEAAFRVLEAGGQALRRGLCCLLALTLGQVLISLTLNFLFCKMGKPVTRRRVVVKAVHLVFA